MRTEINPQETTRATAFELWMSSPMPMVTLVKTLDVPHCHRSTRFSVGLSFLHPRFLHPKGHPPRLFLHTKTATIFTIFHIFLKISFIFFGRKKNITNFADIEPREWTPACTKSNVRPRLFFYFMSLTLYRIYLV